MSQKCSASCERAGHSDLISLSSSEKDAFESLSSISSKSDTADVLPSDNPSSLKRERQEEQFKRYSLTLLFIPTK